MKHQRDVSSLFEPLTAAVRQQGGGGPLSVSMAFHAVNDSLDRYPSRTTVEGLVEDGGETYRVTEEVIPVGLPLTVFAVASRAGGEPVLASTYRGVPAISAGSMPAVLARGGRRTAGWAVLLGAAALALFALAAVLVLGAGG